MSRGRIVGVSKNAYALVTACSLYWRHGSPQTDSGRSRGRSTIHHEQIAPASSARRSGRDCRLGQRVRIEHARRNQRAIILVDAALIFEAGIGGRFFHGILHLWRPGQPLVRLMS